MPKARLTKVLNRYCCIINNTVTARREAGMDRWRWISSIIAVMFLVGCSSRIFPAPAPTPEPPASLHDSRIIFSALDMETDPAGIWSVSPDGSNLTEITTNSVMSVTASHPLNGEALIAYVAIEQDFNLH